MIKYFLQITIIITSIISASCNEKSNKNNQPETIAATPSESVVNNYNGPAGVPSFPMLDINNNQLNSADLKGNLTLIFFNPDCDHCQREAQSINGSKELFKSKQIYFVSVDELDAIRKFRTDYGLTENNFHFAKSDVELVVRAMGPISSVPSMYFFKNGKMTGQMEGEKTAAELAAQM